MAALFSYPGMFGLVDYKPHGLKVFAVLKLSGLGFQQDHVVDASAVPHGQSPYLRDRTTPIGESDGITALPACWKRRTTIAVGLGFPARWHQSPPQTTPGYPVLMQIRPPSTWRG